MTSQLVDPQLYLDPYSVLREMRTTCPVYFDDHLQSWIVTRYDDVVACLKDPRMYVVEECKRVDVLPQARQAELAPLRRIFTEWGGRSVASDHDVFLRVVKKYFTPRRVAGRVGTIQGLLDGLLEAATGHGGAVDVVNELAHPLAMSVVCDLLGAPPSRPEIDRLLRASNAISGLLEMGEVEQLQRSQEGMLDVVDYLRPHIAAARAGRGSGLLSVLTGPAAESLDYDDDQIAAQGIMFVVVGYHTTANLLANGLQLLFDHPGQRRALVECGFANLPNAFDEMMRFHGPVSTIRRVALSDVQLRGQRIAAGDTVVLALLAANRDEAVFDRPDEFLVDRPNANRQVGFTVGPYSCMGQALARLEGQVFFTTLLSRFPRMVPADPQPDWTVFRPLGRELRTQWVLLDGRR
jgi:cytochrome P450